MDHDYVILLLFLLVVPSVAQRELQTSDAPFTETTNQGINAETSWATEAETTVTSSTVETDPNSATNVSWSPDFGPDVTFNFTVDGSTDCCEVTLQGETFQDKINTTSPCENVTVTGLRNGTAYNLTVVVHRGNKGSTGKIFVFATKVAAPSQPTNFTAAETTDTSVTLTWSPPVPYPGATNYTLIVTDLGSRYYQTSEIDEIWTNTSHIQGYDTWNFTVTDLHPAWNYSFSLSAETKANFSNNATTAAHTNDSAPGKVKNLTVTPGQVAYRQVVASWECPDVTDRNTRITGFAVKTTLTLTGPTDVLQNKDKGCDPKKSEIMYVTPDNAVFGQYSGDTCFLKLTTTGCKDRSVTINVTINVTAETQYVVEVQTLGEAYNSTAWASVNISVPAGPSQKVENLKVVSVNGSAVIVQWDEPQETNGVLCGYSLLVFRNDAGCVQRIWYKVSPDKENIGCASNGSQGTEKCTNEKTEDMCTSEFRVGGLHPYTSYNITVFAVNRAEQDKGEGERETCSVTTNMTASDPVTNLNIAAVNESALNVTWSRPKDVHGELLGYSVTVLTDTNACVQEILLTTDAEDNKTPSIKKPEIQQKGFGEKCAIETVIIANISSLNQEITLTDLLPDTRYNITVFAVSGAKEDNGAGHRVSTNGKTNISAPSEPTNFSAMSVTNTSVSLVWSPPVPRPGPTSYTLVITDLGSRYYPSSTDSPQSIEIKGYESASYSVGLRPAWNYTFSLSARTERGSSENITLTMSTSNSVPGTIENLTLTPVKESYKQLNVTWRCPNVTARNTLITGFIIQRNVSVRDPINASNDENVTQYITVTSCEEMLNATIPIQPENQYLIWINTLGQEYNSSYWVKEMYCAPAGPSQKVENLTTVSLNESAVVVQWDEPHETNGVLCGYRLLVFTNSSECVQRIWYKVSPAIENNGCTNTTCEDRELEEKGAEKCINDAEITKDIHSSKSKVAIGGLQPYTAYNITVFAINRAKENNGTGGLDTCSVTTNMSAPSKPTNFSAMSVTNTSVSLVWSPPVPRPGPTSYTLVITDLGSRYYPSSTDSPQSIEIKGYESASYSVGLRPAWNYTFSLSARTERGSSENITLTMSTSNSVPGTIENLTLTPVKESYKQLNVTWRCPNVTARNTLITGFIIQRNVSVRDPINASNDENVTQYITVTSCEEMLNATIPIQPENQYLIWINTLGQEYNSSYWVKEMYCAPAGPSQKVENLTTVSLNESAVVVQWDEPHETNGVLCGYRLLVFTNSSECVQRIWYKVSPAIENNGCTNTTCEDRELEEKGAEKCINDAEITKDIHSSKSKVAIGGLQPYTAYNITVFAINRAKENNGTGGLDTCSVTTNMSAPSKPTNFSAMSVTNTSVSLVWSPPVPRPGPTSYTLVITDLGSRYYPSSTDSPQSIEIKGYENTSYSAKGLHPAWNYTFTLFAHTMRGSSENVTLTISTDDSAPGVVENFTLTPGVVPYKEVVACWRCPSVTARNTRITGFAVRHKLMGQNSVRDVVFAEQYDMSVMSCETVQNITVPLTAESTFKIEVQTLGEHFNGSTWVSAIYNTSAGAPPNMTGTLMLHPVSEGESQTSFPVSFCTSCLFDESNGKIDYFAVIICATESCNQMESFDLATGQGVRNLSSWHEAKNENFQPLYRSTNDTWQKFVRSVTASQSTQATRQKRSPDPYVYVVGEDNDCSTKPVTTYCNGPLPAGRSFRVAVVSCTTQACSRSELSEAFQTLDADDPFPDAAKAGVAAGIFLACVVVVTFLVCKRRFQAKKTEADESTEMTDLTGRPIPMKDFPHKMKNWMSSNLTPGNLPIPLVEEFKEIKELSPKHPQETAKIEGNGFKNRYRNIMPFDHSRVQLKQIPGDECSDYINANFIPGYHSKHEYIATQGPLEQTTADFWRMVWEQNVPVIVMLSRFIDEAVKKVFPYFPEDDHVDEPQKFGTITVTLKRVRILNDFDVRTFTLAVGKVQRSVQHFFISNWVDHGANLDVGFLLEFVKRVRTDVPPGSRNPMVVHCSAGVGRTGTFIALDYLTQYIDNNPPSASIDIFSYVLSMRNCRTSMVQTADQYVLLYLAVDRVLQGRTNRVSFEEPVYANLGYEDDDSPGSDVGRKRAPDAKAKTDVLPKASGQQRAITPGRKKILTRVSSTESSMSCSSGQETSKLPAASKKKKISRPSEQTSKAVLLPETPGRGHPKPMSVADTSKLSEVLTLSSPLEEALASGPAHGGKRTAPKLSTPEGDLQL